MSTRGLFGFRKDGEDKVIYNHFDSYPEGLGASMIEMLKRADMDKLSAHFNNIICADDDSEPTDDIIAQCKKLGLVNTNVSEKSLKDWYCLTRELQDPEKFRQVLESGEKFPIICEIDFIKDSLFCEYAYIFDLNTLVLEVYKGFQHRPQENNRYGTEPNRDGYFPCELVGEISAEAIKRVDVDYLVNYMKSVTENK